VGFSHPLVSFIPLTSHPPNKPARSFFSRSGANIPLPFLFPAGRSVLFFPLFPFFPLLPRFVFVSRRMGLFFFAFFSYLGFKRTSSTLFVFFLFGAFRGPSATYLSETPGFFPSIRFLGAPPPPSTCFSFPLLDFSGSASHPVVAPHGQFFSNLWRDLEQGTNSLFHSLPERLLNWGGCSSLPNPQREATLR